MERFGLPPGPAVGRLLEQARARPRPSGWSPRATRRSRTLTRLRAAPRVSGHSKRPNQSFRRLRMLVWKIAAAAIVAMLVSSPASAAPAGKVVLAQGVDPPRSTWPISRRAQRRTWAATFSTPCTRRDTNLKIVPALATEMPKFVPPSAWEVKLRQRREVPQRRRLQRRLGEVQPRAPGEWAG